MRWTWYTWLRVASMVLGFSLSWLIVAVPVSTEPARERVLSVRVVTGTKDAATEGRSGVPLGVVMVPGEGARPAPIDPLLHGGDETSVHERLSDRALFVGVAPSLAGRNPGAPTKYLVILAVFLLGWPFIPAQRGAPGPMLRAPGYLPK